jgi:hypothetical protein
MKILVLNSEKQSIEDNFKEGEIGKTHYFDGPIPNNTVFDTFEDFTNAASLSNNKNNYYLDSENGNLLHDRMEDEEGYEATKADIKDFEDGMFNLYSATYTFVIELVEPIVGTIQNMADFLEIQIQ